MNSTPLPNLTFPSVKFGANETPWDLISLLYKGGAATRINLVAEQIQKGTFGGPILERLPLIQAFHQLIDDALEAGGPRDTASSEIAILRTFYAFADRNGHSMTLETVKDTFIAFADELFARTLIKRKATPGPRKPGGLHPLKLGSAITQGNTVSTKLDEILDRQTPLISATRLITPRIRKSVQGIQAEKQNLKQTFEFGHLLQDICDALTLENMQHDGLRIHLRSGEHISLGRDGDAKTSAKIDGGTDPIRNLLVNIRIEAELQMFIGQTGLNLEQAHNAQLANFAYASHLDGYQVKDRKARRSGAVLFEIFRDYKEHFERYLRWRKIISPSSIRLFPFVRREGTREDSRFQGHRIRRLCRALGKPYISPRELRGTRVNWILRESGNPELTAEMSQHTQETLGRDYEKPSLQRASVQALRFWDRMDPTRGRTIPIAPGECLGYASPLPERPNNIPKPDCTNTAGCLWCESHRDVDAPEYVWALHSFLHLKLIEESKSKLTKRDNPLSPNFKTLERIQEKLAWFKSSNATRRSWAAEAAERISNEDFHPDWRSVILELHGVF